MSTAFLAAIPRIRTRNPIAQQFPELSRNVDEDLLFTDQIDQLAMHSVYSDGRSQAHLSDH